MIETQAFPYLRPSPSRIQAGTWQIGANHEPVPPGEFVPHWDPAVRLQLVRLVEIDVPGLYGECDLSDGDRLRLAVVWHCPGTGLRGRACAVDFDGPFPASAIELRAELDGFLLTDRVLVHTQIVLLEGRGGAPPLTPRRAGSLLWSDSLTIALEHPGSRFPVETVDFSTGFPSLPPGAGWYLDWNPDDLDSPVTQNIRLLLNAGHSQVVRAITTNPPLSADRAVRDTIRLDVARSIVTAVLQRDEFVARDGDYADGSVGLAARRLIRASFGAAGLGELREELMNEPARFDARLQDAVRLFRQL